MYKSTPEYKTTKSRTKAFWRARSQPLKLFIFAFYDSPAYLSSSFAAAWVKLVQFDASRIVDEFLTDEQESKEEAGETEKVKCN